MNLRSFISTTIAVIALLVSSVCFAQVRFTDGGLSGQWWNPSRDGEGLFVEIIETNAGPKISVAWFTYDGQGFQMWLTGAADLEGSPSSVTIPVVVTGGPKFGNAYNPADLQRSTWGTLTLTFNNCDSGLLSYASSVDGFGSGGIELTRITSLRQVQCMDPPPPVGSGITPGKWNGDGVCFYVSEDGRTLTSNGSGCLGGRAFDLELNGTDQNGNACKVVVECTGVIAIVDNGFTCNSSKGEAIAMGSFINGGSNNGGSATGAAQQVENSNVCTAFNWKALPNNP